MAAGDETPPGSGAPDPEGPVAPRSWGPTPRRWVPGETWLGGTRISNAPSARRSALTPLPEDDEPSSAPRRSAMSPLEEVEAPASRARRSAMSPGEDDDDFDAVVPRRSAMSPLPSEEPPARVARRSAFTPTEPDKATAPRRSGWVEDDAEDEDDGYEETLRLPLPRHSSEYASAARAIQPALPDLGPTPESPVETLSPVESAPSVTTPASPFSPSVQPALPDPALSEPVEAGSADTELLSSAPLPVIDVVTVEGHVSSVEPITFPAEEEPVITVSAATMAEAAIAAEVMANPAITELPAALLEEQELLAEEADMVSEGGPPVDDDVSHVGDDTGTWLFGSAFSTADHSLYKRPAPGEPETEVDLTPIVIDDPEYDVRKGTKPLAKPSPRPVKKTARPGRKKSARRVELAWRDHRRLLTILAIVVAALLVVGVAGYLFSRFNPTIANITEGKLTLPTTAASYQRDPSQGATPSMDPGSKIQTVSATYTLNGNQEFVAIAYRPQTDPSAALAEIQARNITKVSGGACGRTVDQNRMACAVVSGTTAVLLVTVVDQTADELIAAAQSVSDGIGKI